MNLKIRKKELFHLCCQTYRVRHQHNVDRYVVSDISQINDSHDIPPPKKMLAKMAPKGLLIETPSTWAYITSSKLNFIRSVANFLNSKNKVGGRNQVISVEYIDTV